MPGRLHVRPGRVWWVAEGTREAVSLQGLASPAPLEDVEVPRELTFGVIRCPLTLRVHLSAGGDAHLTFHRRYVRQVAAGLNGEPAVRDGSAPRGRAHAPIERLAVPSAGVLLTFVGLLARRPSAPAMIVGGLIALAGFEVLHRGMSRLSDRRARVRLSRGSRVSEPTRGG